MDPVQKAVINHTFGVTMVPKKKQVISCNVCQLRFNSDVSICFLSESHTDSSISSVCPRDMSIRQNEMKLFLVCLAQSQAEAHYRGSRHAKKLKSQENKAKLSINEETNGSVSCPVCPAPDANSSTNQHPGWL